MCNRQTDKLQIPVELSRHVVKNGLEKSFAIYLYLKFHSSGKIHKDAPAFQSIKKDLGINTNRTYQKHFQKLLDLNWINLSENSGLYYIRGFDRIRLEHQCKNRQATTLYYKNLKKLKAFLVGTILGAAVNGKKYVWEVVIKRKLRPVANKRDATSPARAYADRPKPEYYGLSLPEIADLLGCKKTRASQLRQLAAKAGFIKTRHRFMELTRLAKADYNIREYLYELYPQYKNKIRFTQVVPKGKRKTKAEATIIVAVQLHDEIIPKLQFKSISKFNNLVVAPQIKLAIAKRQTEVAKIAA